MSRITVIFMLLVASWLLAAFAVPHHMDEKRQVVGTVRDYDKRGAIVVLEKHSGWDRKQTQFGLVASKIPRRIIRWLKRLDDDQLAIWIKASDMGKIRRGTKIEIVDYHYIADEFAIYPKYRELRVLKR